MATIVSETIWNPTQEIIKLDNNTIKLTAKVPDLKEVARWILSSAPYIIVESPDELRIIVHDIAEQMTKLNPITPSNATTDHFRENYDKIRFSTTLNKLLSLSSTKSM